MTREELYDYIYSNAKEQLSDCLKESEIILTKDKIDGKESTYLALHTSGNGFAPAFDLDGYYDQYILPAREYKKQEGGVVKRLA